MCIIDMRSSRLAERGVTLIELVIFIVVVSLAVGGILLVMNNTTLHSGDPQLRKQALAIAESLLEEVELARFTYCNPTDPQAPFATTVAALNGGAIGPQPPGSSATNAPGFCTSAASIENFAAVSGSRPYGNVINYVPSLGGTTTYTTTNGTLTDANGTPLSGLSGTFTATITIKSGTALGGTAYSDPGANPNVPGALLITVAVTYPEGVITLDGYRTQYAPQLMP